MIKLITNTVLIALVALPHVANAESKKSLDDIFVPIDKQPAVRGRILWVKKRFEVTPLFESTVNAEYRHSLGPGLKLEYHFSDMFSIGVLGVYNVSIDTNLTERIVETLPDTSNPNYDADPTPSKDQYSQHLNSIPIHGAAYVSFTPWYGKLAAFDSAFLSFDFYFQAGVALAMLENSCNSSVCSDENPDGEPGMPGDRDPRNDLPLNDGTKIGLYLGGGIHLFLSEWLALDLTVRSYLFSDNPSGLDTNFDRKVTDDDSSFSNHLFMGVGFSIMLPTKAKRTP